MPFTDTVTWGFNLPTVSVVDNMVTFKTIIFENYEELGFGLSILCNNIVS